MVKSKLHSNINMGKVEKIYAHILDFTLEEIELLQGKLRGRKQQLIGNDKNRNRDTIQL